MRHATVVLLASFALAAPAAAQVAAPTTANPALGCYAFNGADETSGGTIEERFRLTAEPSPSRTLPGPWQVVSAVPGGTLRGASASWSVGANTMIRVVWEYASARVLLQFPQMEDEVGLPVEGMLAGPGPERGVAQTARGFVVRVSC